MPANGSTGSRPQPQPSRRRGGGRATATMTPPRGVDRPPTIAALPVAGQRDWASSSMDLELISAAAARQEAARREAPAGPSYERPYLPQRDDYAPDQYAQDQYAPPAPARYFPPASWSTDADWFAVSATQPAAPVATSGYQAYPSYPTDDVDLYGDDSLDYGSAFHGGSAFDGGSALDGARHSGDVDVAAYRRAAVAARWDEVDLDPTDTPAPARPASRRSGSTPPGAAPTRRTRRDIPTISITPTPAYGITFTGAPDVPLTRREARARQDAEAADLRDGRAPASRAQRREADRQARRRAATSDRSNRNRKAALTVALVGLGVGLVHETLGGAGDSVATVASPVQAHRTSGTPDAAARASASPYSDIYGAYSQRSARARHRTPSATPSTEAATVATTPETASATASRAGRATTPAAGDGASTSARSSNTGVADTGVAGTTVQQARSAVAGAAVTRLYGTPRSGLAWASGWWVGGNKTSSSIAEAEQWRGSKIDMATVYSNNATWDSMKDDWSITVWKGFGGQLSYGLGMLPNDRRGQWGDVTSGAHDDVFRTIARNLKANGFGHSAVRVGVEANGDWYPWAANASNAAQYKEAFRRIVGIMRAEAPDLTFWFDTAAAAGPVPGASGRDSLFTTLYPGDDVVDGIAMDHYDFYSLVAHTDAEFTNAMRPSGGAGLQDAADFARAHKKGFSVPEWGLHGVQGPGDNPFFMKKMFEFFTKNKDVLVFESYFDEPDPYIGNSLKTGQDPQSAAVYRQLWAGK